jgi:signal transduction histidine kinase
VFKAAVDVISRDGSGFNEYVFPKPGTHRVAPKISFNAAYAPWDWIVTTGAYVDDIDTAFRAQLYRSVAVLVALATVLSVVAAVINRRIVRSVAAASDEQHKGIVELNGAVAQMDQVTQQLRPSSKRPQLLRRR